MSRANRGRHWFTGKHPTMRYIARTLEKAATGADAILITGESGTGKEVLAQEIRRAGPRADKPFIAVNCAATQESLIDDLFFGHSKGAFTGAFQGTKGAFMEADGGILFLDEIGTLPLYLQSKLLRALEERLITPLGTNAAIPVDIQVISATNTRLEAAVSRGTFRLDLYYRLNLIEFCLPPLRERKADIADLASAFCAKLAREHNKPPRELDPETLELFKAYPWPGNVRELVNVLRRGYILDEPFTLPEHPIRQSGPELPSLNLEELKRSAARQALKENPNRKAVARQLGISLHILNRLAPPEPGNLRLAV